jgi:predicted amidohydrolase YtcJ
MKFDGLHRVVGVVAIAVSLSCLGVSSGCSARVAGPSTSKDSTKEWKDLLIVNAKIWTGGGRYSEPTATSIQPSGMLVRNGRIAAIGSDLHVYSYATDETRVIDAQGLRIIPGITDSHAHIIGGGFQLERLNLRDVKNKSAFIAAVKSEVRRLSKGEWVLGGRWSVDSWESQAAPHKSWLDPVTGDVPVFLSRMDGHEALVNSAALKLAGITSAGPEDPKGGEIQRNPKTGEPTGILKESAKGLVSRHIPTPSAERRYEALLRAMKYANSLGITSIHDLSSPADLEAYRRAKEEGALSVRITTYLSVSDWAGYVDKISGYRLYGDMVHLAGFKGYMDGAMGSRTAYMREPYDDLPKDHPYPCGQLNAMADPPERFKQAVAMVDERGFQLAVHAIGDEANHQLLDAYAYAAERKSGRRVRHRVEHAQHLLVEDIPRFAKLGVVASMQPFHKADDGRYAEKAIGKSRLAGSYAFRQLVDSRALVIFGSDWPVVTLNPFAGIDSAVNAKTLSGDVWLASHSLSVEEAIRAYTVMPPRAIRRDDRLGTLEIGKYADFLILSDDPFTFPKEDIGAIKVVKTFVGGKMVYDHSCSVGPQ